VIVIGAVMAAIKFIAALARQPTTQWATTDAYRVVRRDLGRSKARLSTMSASGRNIDVVTGGVPKRVLRARLRGALTMKLSTQVIIDDLSAGHSEAGDSCR
jgi:hypothetical protein